MELNQQAGIETSTARQSGMRSAGILFVACVVGWAVMELEILGVRIMVPVFGGAIYVVTGSIIGVFLLSLAVGYMIGGWLSGLGNPRRTLGTVILAAGVCFVVMASKHKTVCEAIFNLDWDVKWGSLLASLVLFGPPTALLGTVSPLVVHWLSEGSGRTGYWAGTAMAISTVASFAGCIVTAFYLVLYSLKTTLVATGLALVVLGALMLLIGIWVQRESVVRGSTNG
ncbi:MAG: fused MFS/spermidine synthase [Phycisphaerae bacterium]|nr:fused MFS/spermidine synthase [Phycisphaerae bacterium]